MADEHLCEDCGTTVTRKNNRGPWPKKCPDCKAGKATPEPQDAPEPLADGTGEAEGTGEPGAASEPSEASYTRVFKVRRPALYLDDDAWHEANAELVVKEATEQGLHPTGECRCTDVQDDDPAFVVVTYTVPVKERT